MLYGMYIEPKVAALVIHYTTTYQKYSPVVCFASFDYSTTCLHTVVV
jgi:hypothetical protein